MSVEIKVVSQELYELCDELSNMSSNINTEFEMLFGRLLDLDKCFFSSHSEALIKRAQVVYVDVLKEMGFLKSHIEKLELIAADYEKTERENENAANGIS